MRIVAAAERCVGAGQCLLTQPRLFDQSEADGTVVILVERVDGDLLDDAREAVQLCPSRALSLAGD